MIALPDWAVFVLISIALLLAGGSGAWLLWNFLIDKIIKFIAKYTK